jgi:hypothetical protein
LQFRQGKIVTLGRLPILWMAVDYSAISGDGRAMQLINVARKRKLQQQILLFHFWNNYGRPKREDKAKRLKEKLEELKAHCDAENPRNVNCAYPRLLLPLYDEMDEAFQKVFELYAPHRDAFSALNDLFAYFS